MNAYNDLSWFKQCLITYFAEELSLKKYHIENVDMVDYVGTYALTHCLAIIVPIVDEGNQKSSMVYYPLTDQKVFLNYVLSGIADFTCGCHESKFMQVSRTREDDEDHGFNFEAINLEVMPQTPEEAVLKFAADCLCLNNSKDTSQLIWERKKRVFFPVRLEDRVGFACIITEKPERGRQDFVFVGQGRRTYVPDSKRNFYRRILKEQIICTKNKENQKSWYEYFDGSLFVREGKYLSEKRMRERVCYLIEKKGWKFKQYDRYIPVKYGENYCWAVGSSFGQIYIFDVSTGKFFPNAENNFSLVEPEDKHFLW